MDLIFKILSRINPRRSGLILCIIILALFLTGFKSIIYRSEINNEPIINLTKFPMTLGEWVGEESVGMDIRSLDILKLTTYVRRRYTNPEGKSVFLYIGYWANQSGEHQAAKHSPALCLPSNGWQTTHLDNYLYDDPELKLENKISIRKIIGEKRLNSELFYYWFFTGNKYYSQEWYALIELSLSNLFYGRNDGGIVEVSTSIPGTNHTEEALGESSQTIEEFTKVLIPYLHKQIKTGNGS